MADQSNHAERYLRWLSPLRFDVFKDAAGGDIESALRLYEWNALISGALLEVVGHVEVVVRNAIHHQLKADTAPNALQSWLTDRDLLGDKQVQAVVEAIGRLKRSKKEPTEDRVVAGLYFSFWSAMVGRSYEELWRRSLAKAFPNAANRNELAGPMNRAVQLRNKLAHHQSLINDPIEDRVEDLLFVAYAVDADARAWIESVSRVGGVLADRPEFPRRTPEVPAPDA
ncbi:MAG: hypothetical protein JWQ18_1258 [Conexibacter sp.]|nr:hypothetical protein [Conexibacter sp.]